MKTPARRVVAKALSRIALVALAALAVLTLAALVGILGGWWRLTAAALALDLLVIGVVAADTNRQVRRNARRLQRGVRAVSHDAMPVAPRSSAGRGDDGGVARILQAQYVGRLDRAQSSLEEAAAELHRAAERAATADSWPQVPGAQVVVTRVDAESIQVVRAALAQGHPVAIATDDIATARQQLTEQGLGTAVTFTGPETVPPAVSISLSP